MNNETKSSRFKLGSKIASIFLSAALLATTFTGLGSTLIRSGDIQVAAASDYGLADKIEDGNILHCFDWKLSDITAALPEIAEAGFTSIQTSPLQTHDASGAWYWLYQPTSFNIGNELGSYSDLQTLCSEADKYGIKIIVDVVANHLAGWNSGEWAGSIYGDLRKSEYFHNQGPASNWNDRNEIIYKNIGMPDLNSENETLQNIILAMVSKYKEAGVDGIRWDAAKHIGLPSEGCNFWSKVSAMGMYNYGEILDGPAGEEYNQDGTINQQKFDQNSRIMTEYGKYIGVTDNNYSGEITGAIRDGKVTTRNGKWSNRGVNPGRVVYWAESHDTYCNEENKGGWTKNLSESIMDRSYAVSAARANSQALYLSRPFEKANDSIMYGAKGSTHFTSKEVAAVNHFHNAMIGTKEYYTTAENCFVVCREGGAVIVNAGGGGKQVTVPNGGGLVPAGTYTDEITGSTWTVTSSTMSGHIGDTGIAVFYNGGVTRGSVSLSPSTGSFTDTMTVTLNANNVTNATYTTSEGDSGSYTSGKTITIGSKASVGSTVTISLSGTTESGEKVTASGSYVKKDPNAVTTIYFDNSSYNWSAVYAYIYNDDSSVTPSPTPTPTPSPTPSGTILFSDTLGWGSVNAYFFNSSGTVGSEWPGSQMASNGQNDYGQNQFKASIPSGATHVIFNNNGTQTGDLPLAGVAGYYLDGSADNAKSWSSSASSAATANAEWPGVKMTLNSSLNLYEYVVPDNLVNGRVIFSDGSNSAANRYPADMEPGLAINDTSKKFSAGNKWEAYKPTPVPVPGVPTVTVDKASGTSFTDETLTINLSLKDAASGTYSVDGGPTKTFTSSTPVVIGEGKIGDSTVTVETTAKGSDGTTKSYTFTYEKKYKVKTTSSSAASSNSKYSTNPGGNVGANKTIKSASDFTEDTLIAKGIANDDPAAFKGTHEAPKFDLYALYAAWDNENMYIGIQYTNVIDVVDPAQEAPQGGRGKPNGADADIPQMLLFDLKSGDYTDGSTNSAKQSTVWNTNITFGGDTKVDKVIMYSPKEGIDNYAVFPVTNGKIDYDNAISYGYQAALPGASIKWEDGFFCSTMYGIKANGYEGYKPADIEGSSGNWVDFLTTNHSKTQDTFCIITMPLKYLGVSASDISSKGIGLMAVATYGESGIGCLPHDTVMLDNATEPYDKDDSTSGEKCDADQITVPLASVGKSSGVTPTPKPTPTPDPDKTPLQVNFGTDKSAPQLTTTALTIKGVGMGGTAPYKYEFSVDGTVVKASNTTATYSWKPGTAKKHTLKCVITDSKGATATATKTFTAEGTNTPVPDPITFSNTSKVSATFIKLGSSVTVTAASSGGTGTIQYAVYYKQKTQTSWTKVRDYETGTSIKVTPKAATQYTIRVKAKDGKGTIKDKDFTINVQSGALANTSKVSATTITQGKSVKVTCASTGGTGSKTYAVFYIKSGQTSWTKIKGYTAETTATVTPKGTGTYKIRVKAKDGKGTIKDKDFTITVKAGALANTSKVSATTITQGNAVTVTCAATGGSGTKQYAVFYKQKAQDSWTKVRGYATGTSVKVTPRAATSYTIRVKAKDGKGTIVNKDFTVKVSKTFTVTAKASASSVALGKSVTVTGSVTGATGTVQYEISYLKIGTSSWTKAKAYNTTAKATIKFPSSGNYSVRVNAKDSTGTVMTAYVPVTVTA